MGSVIFLVATVVIAYLVDAIFVGALLHTLRSRYPLSFSEKRTPMVLFAIFCFLDLYWLPAVIALDVQFRIQNQTVADFLRLPGEYGALDIFGFGWFELFTWSMQVLVAVWVANKLRGVAEKADQPTE